MPNLRELVESTGAKIDDWFYNPSNPQYESNQQLLSNASAALYGNVGANLDTRNWDEIMASDNTIQAANDALAAMYSDPGYRERNTANLATLGYNPAQAYITYDEMNDRVGANYTPTASEIAAVDSYFKKGTVPDWWEYGSGAKATTAPPTVKQTASAASTSGGLTPEIAANLMRRSMTTGVPTSEFDKYGGYDAVKALYDSNKGTYSLEELSPDFLDQMDNVIANTGVGNLSVLKMTGEPLTKAGYQAMQNNGVNFTEADLKSMGIPYEGFLQVPKKAGSTTGTGTNGVNTAGQLTGGAQVMGPLLSGGYGGGWNARQAFGAADGSMLGAGDANYHSSLIKSLRQNSMTPFSTNAGVLMAPNMGSTTSNWTSPATGGSGGAFNPQVLNPRTASPQEIADWNAYSTYRTNSLNAKTPIVSFAEWLAGGKKDGTQQPTPTTPVYDPVYDSSLGGG